VTIAERQDRQRAAAERAAQRLLMEVSDNHVLGLVTRSIGVITLPVTFCAALHRIGFKSTETVMAFLRACNDLESTVAHINIKDAGEMQ
jgi:hypothetical protein